MNNIIGKITVFMLLFFLPNWSYATHIVGGEMTYNCLGNDMYEIKLTIFRDCENGDPYFDNPASVGIFDGSNSAYLYQEFFNITSIDDTLDLALNNPCYTLPPDVCIHTVTYRKTIRLPYRVGGYHLSYQRCCRNNIITNISNASSTGATYDVAISEAALTNCNSSPRFREWPPFYLCAGSLIDYDNSAFDPDGDSLVYELCAPSEGGSTNNPVPSPPQGPPYAAVSWLSPYGLNNMLGGANPLRINSSTGRLTGIPPMTGTFVVGVCVKEYRNGVLIGMTKRDFQYSIGICNRLIQADFSVPTASCNQNLTVLHTNNSTPINSLYTWDFGDNSNPVTTTNPNHTYPDTGYYTITLVAGVGMPCADTLRKQIHLQLDAADISLTPTQYICPNELDTFLFVATNNLLGYNTITSYNWVTNGTVISGLGTDSLWVLGNGNNVIISLSVTNNLGCTDQNNSRLEVDVVRAVFDTTMSTCNTDLAVALQNRSTTTRNTFFWDFGGTGTSTAVLPTHTFPDTGTYNVMLIAGYGGNCEDTITQAVRVVLDGLSLLHTTPPFACSSDTLNLRVTNALAAYNSINQYTWTANQPILAGQASPQITLVAQQNIDYSVIATNNNGCSDTIAASIPVHLAEAMFDSIDLKCSRDLTVDFTNTSQTSGGSYLWTYDNITSTDLNPSHTFADTGAYQVSLIAGIGTPCQDTFSRVLDMQINEAQIMASDSQIVCRGDTVLLTASNLLPNYNSITNYQWTPAANIISGQGTDSVLALANADIQFQVIGYNDANCQDTAFSRVNVTQISPNMTTWAVPDSIFLGQQSQLYATDVSDYIYSWLPDTTLSDWAIFDPLAKPRQTKTYYLTVSNKFNCFQLDSVTVYIKKPECVTPVVFVPSAFTPDGDGHNDILMVEGNNINYMTLKIYNRWGQQVFESKDKSIGWDGTFNGQTLPPDVYGYYMQCSCDEGGQLLLKGNITLIR